MPIAHGEGNYEDSPANLDQLEAERRVVLRYVSPEGAIDESWNFNGSARGIAGVTNERGNVLGLMPHPERCAEAVLGNTDGLALFAGAVAASLRPPARPQVAALPAKPKVVRRPAVRR